jgi:hypothetical protein
MSSILRISGDSLDIDALLALHPLSADRVWKKGEPQILKGKFHADSGVSFIASDADLDEFNRQVLEATEYLALHATIIAEMVAFPGVQKATLDFGVSIYEGYVTHFSYLPPRVVQLAANAGIGLEVSYYACSKDNEES